MAAEFLDLSSEMGTRIPRPEPRFSLTLRRGGPKMRVILVSLALGVVAPSLAAAAPPTFSKDVAPILYKSCAECHRPTSIAPMSLITYDDARPWARAVKQKVVAREMPPWGADPHIGKFANDPSLSDAEVATITAWVDAGAPEGDRADLPKPPT